MSRWWAAVAAVLVLAAGCGGDDDTAQTADSPFEIGRSPTVIAAVGEGRLLVVGGLPGGEIPDSPADRSREAGIVDPATGESTRVPDPPFDPLTVGAAVTVGDHVVVVGTSCPTFEEGDICPGGSHAAAVFEIGDQDWTELDLPDALDRERDHDPGLWALGLGATGEGDAVVVLGDREAHWRVDPGSGDWTALPPPPAPVRASCLAGDTLVVLDDPAPVVLDPSTPETLAPPTTAPGPAPPGPPPVLRLLRVTGGGEPRWTDAPAPPAGANASDLLCAGDHALLVPTMPGGVVPVLDTATGTWTETTAPGLAVAGYMTAVDTGDAVVVADGPVPGREEPAWRYDSTTASWEAVAQLERTPLPAGLVWDGTAILGYGAVMPDGGPEPFRHEIRPA